MIYAWGWQKSARFRDAVCGRRFGKTFLGKAEMRRAARLAAEWGVSVEDEIWYCAPTFNQAKRVFWRRLKQAIPPSWRAGKPNETECSITLASGHLMRIVGLDVYDNLRGSGLFFALIDEWADCKYEAWEEVLRPMLSTCKYTVNGEPRIGGHALRIGTPKGFNHCFDSYQDGQGAEPDHKSWLYTSLDGGNVPSEELEAAKRKMDPRTFRQEYMASFENYQGVIYYCFDRRENHTDEVIKPGDALHIGMDFNVSKMAAVVHVLRNHEPRAVDELIDLFDTPAMISAIQGRYPGHPIIVYPDAAGQARKSVGASETDLSLLRKAGFMVVVDSTNPGVKDRINSMCAMFLNAYGQRRYLVNTSKCPKYTTSLERHIYDEKGQPKKAKKGEKDPGFDHACFTGDTIVTTRTGMYRFDEIPESGEVIGPHGDWVEYHGAGKTGHKETVTITFADGYVIQCSHDHLFITGNGEWIQAKDLMGRECVLLVKPAKSSRAGATTFAGSTIKTLRRRMSDAFTALCGSPTTGLFRKAITYITATKTAPITKSRISIAFHHASTWSTMARIMSSVCAKWASFISAAQKHGSQPKKADKSSARTMRGCLTFFKLALMRPVHAAASTSKRRYQSKTSKTGIAQRLAAHMHEGRAALTMLSANAPSVDARSEQTNTARLKTVASVSRQGAKDVYCLTVPDYGCFKLGEQSPIVSNCDAAGYFITKQYPLTNNQLSTITIQGQ